MCVHDLLDDVETEPEATVVLRRDGPLKAVEDSRMLITRDPDALVRDHESRAVRVAAHRHANGKPPTEREGVAKEVRDQLLDARGVPLSGDRPVPGDLDQAPRAGRLGGERLDRVAHRLEETDRLELQRDRARRDLRRVEQRGD